MELETIKHFENNELEDGELSDNSDDGYTPLQRPEIIKQSNNETIECNKMDANQIEEDSISDFGKTSDSSSSDSDDCMKNGPNKKKEKRTILLRVKSMQQLKEKPKFKKYDIWTASLQEDSLMENMRGIGVAKNDDRNVENYDYSLKYCLNGENTLKRRLSISGDDMSDENNYYHHSKRTKSSGSRDRRSVKDRLGRRKGSSSSCDSQNKPRHILDLNITPESKNDEIARQIANKLCEKKDELLVRIVDVLGKDLPIALFKETQRIEKDGGMMIMNGKRRRTPGGVFLFLLKHHDTVTPDEKKEIFLEERKNSIKEQKTIQSIKRDKKVEELKKRLSAKEKELTPLITRSEMAVTSSSHLKPESTTLSNPPPSPVASQEYSPEYKSHAINHVSDEKPRISNDLEDESLSAYDDIFDAAGSGDVMDMF